MTSHARQNKAKKKKNKKLFKDVPKDDLLKLADMMKVFVIGQDEAVEQIVEAVQRASVGLKDPQKPIGSFLFAGRTGIGKTLTTKVLADELIKDRNNLITIDCSEYSADHEYAKLIGAPSGYVGHEQGGILTNAVLEAPFSVVVFDEIEKASHKVHEILLQILEEGRLTDGKGQKVSFKDCIVILTSNIGVAEVDDVKKTIGFGDVAKVTEEKKNKAIDAAIKKKFKPEFLNRIDSTVHFRSLGKTDYMSIIDIELYKLNDNLRSNDTEFKSLTLEFDKKAKNFVFKHGIDEDYGARPLKRCIEKEISTLLAARLLRGDIVSDATVEVTVKRGKVDFTIKIEEIEKESSEYLVT
jgi:ATP-dependent Clp protease ATP-binding subunit ClpC